jgi:hypothetical protein
MVMLWTLAQWMCVVWSDETSVELGSKRGKRRIWRRPNEVCEEYVIRRRWKGHSVFMFWGCFTWLKKGPCHIWKEKSPAMTKKYDIIMAKYNEGTKKQARQEWELQNGLKRLGLRIKPGRKPVFKFNKKRGA